MSLLFKDPFLDEFGTWPLAYIPYGGVDFGEIQAVATATGDGNEADFYENWLVAGERFLADADEVLQNGRRNEAKAQYLKASEMFATAYHPIFGSPVDARLVKAFEKQVHAFDKAMALSDPPVKVVRIPFENTTMPAYFIPAKEFATKKRPVLIITNGYDATVTDIYFASAVAASGRGYHCLLFDGPGQGELLFKQNIPLRPDWESVISPIVDFVLTLPEADHSKIALYGWSLGGYFSLRAATGERRLAACIADPGLSDVGSKMANLLKQFGATDEQAQDPTIIDQEILDRVMAQVTSDRRMTWTFVQRGFWANGVDNLRDFIIKSKLFTVNDRISRINCPTLLAAAEEDRVVTFADAEALLAKLKCPKKLIKFYSARGAGGHCEMNNRSLLNRKMLDWLDDVLQ